MTSPQVRGLLHAPELASISAPTRIPPQEVVLWRSGRAGAIAQEIFRRDGGTFGVRYVAWVSQRDAGGNIQGHLWRTIGSAATLVADSLEVAKVHADQDAKVNGIDCFEDWRTVV